MNLHLAIPDLLWPFPDDPHVLEGLALPALEALLGKGRLVEREHVDLESWLLQQFDAPSGSAPYALAADGGEAADSVWLRADPCHLQLNRDKLVLADASAFELSREEAEALVQTLNEHFAGDGLTFYPLHPERWYLRLDELPAITTTPLYEARGRDIDRLLPSGDAGMLWRRNLNEIQMLLHQHPVNEAREERGEVAINSVWLWGAGRMEAPARQAYVRVRSSDPLAAGLAQSSGAAIMPLPDAASAWLPRAERTGVELMLLDHLAAPASYGDAHTWRTRLETLERDWLAPLLAALRSGQIGMLTLHALGRGGDFELETTRQDLRYFWRRPKRLATFVRDDT